jgi:Na+/H+ antiporter NhaA
VSLFITDLAFNDAALSRHAKVGILTASVVAVLIGSALLLMAPGGTAAQCRRPFRQDS